MSKRYSCRFIPFRKFARTASRKLTTQAPPSPSRLPRVIRALALFITEVKSLQEETTFPEMCRYHPPILSADQTSMEAMGYVTSDTVIVEIMYFLTVFETSSALNS